MDVVVAGFNNDQRFAVVDFTNATNPSSVLISAPFVGGCMVDVSDTLAAVGNFNGDQVGVYDISNPAQPVLKGSVNTMLSGISIPHAPERLDECTHRHQEVWPEMLAALRETGWHATL